MLVPFNLTILSSIHATTTCKMNTTSMYAVIWLIDVTCIMTSDLCRPPATFGLPSDSVGRYVRRLYKCRHYKLQYIYVDVCGITRSVFGIVFAKRRNRMLGAFLRIYLFFCFFSVSGCLYAYPKIVIPCFLFLAHTA